MWFPYTSQMSITLSLGLPDSNKFAGAYSEGGRGGMDYMGAWKKERREKIIHVSENSHEKTFSEEKKYLCWSAVPKKL